MSSRTVLAVVADSLLVVLFAGIGRASHDEGVLGAYGLGLAQTAWPFLVGLVLGWSVTRAWRRPAAPVRTGIVVWACTLVGGMLLRAVSGQGTALPFVIVAAIALFALLVGWRLVAAGIGSLRERRTA